MYSIPSSMRLNAGWWGSEKWLLDDHRRIHYRHHVVPRVKLYVPQEETFPIPMKYIDVTRTTCTSLDVMLEKNIEDYWNVDGERELSVHGQLSRDSFSKRKATWRIYMVRGATDEDTNDLKTGQSCGRQCGNTGQMHPNVRKSKNGPSKNQNSITPEVYVDVLHWSEGWGIQGHHEKRS